MSKLPLTFLDVPERSKATIKGYSQKYHGYAMEGGELGDFVVINQYLSKKDQITIDDIKELFPDYIGYITYDQVKAIIKHKKVSSILIGYIEDEILTLENHLDERHNEWGVIIWEKLDAVPVAVKIEATSDVEYSPLGILKKSPSPTTATETSSAKSKKSVSFSEQTNEGPTDTTIYTAEYLKEWYMQREIVPTKADGKCGAHALRGALLDIGKDIPLDEIIANLVSRDVDSDVYTEDPKKLAKLVLEFWSIESIMDYVSDLGIGLRVMRLEQSKKPGGLPKISYWSSRYKCNQWIGLWADGYHYQWTRPKILPGKASWVSFDDSDDEDDIKKKKRHSKKQKKSSKASTTDKKLQLAKNAPSVEGEIQETLDHLAGKDEIKEDNKFSFFRKIPKMLTENVLGGVRKTLYNSHFYEYFPKSLQDYICNSNYIDLEVEYSHPEIQDLREDMSVYIPEASTSFQLHIPYRLDLPLLPLPNQFLEYTKSGKKGLLGNMQKNHSSNLQGFRRELLKLENQISMLGFDLGGILGDATLEINKLKSITRLEFGYREQLVSRMCAVASMRALRNDFAIASKANEELSGHFLKPPSIPSYLLLIQRIRAMLTQPNALPKPNEDEFLVTRFSNGAYFVRSGVIGKKFFLFSAGNFFIFKHEDQQEAFLGSSVYLDYSIAYSEVRHNLGLIRSSREYTWLRELIDFLLEHSERNTDHNTAVTFMKNYESFCLNLSDILGSEFVNWAPILDTLTAMVKLSNDISKESVTIEEILYDLFNNPPNTKVENDLYRIINICKKLTGVQLQEISSLHKFLYFAECDEKKGITKYLKRVHTPRKVDPVAIAAMVNYAKREFIINYHKRHSVMPNMKETNSTTMIIKELLLHRNYTQLRSYPLDWFKNVTPWNCLDNTTTQDPLEVAKDKGAVKEEIHFGPGDSRRELLQLIEKKDYKFTPLPLEDYGERIPQEVKLIRRSIGEVVEKNATRLNPKEKEQKVDTRLYGIATLKNKHGLSILMNKAKKALSYFETQVMTCQDKERKIKLHDMSQGLQDKNTFSVLLDIEGHNQSMQVENCADLYEFVGNLFGEDNWRNLPNYFNNLTVYYYNEYIDETIVSKGQLGGIEGWMNPLWTLHTSIMIDLLGPMCGLHTSERSSYSDDVAFLLKLMVVNQEHIDQVFTTVKDHCQRFGMTVKMLQTSVTKNRMTLLRQHYYQGERADATLKRLLSVSSFNNGVIISEELELAAISSSTSSALEMTEHVLTCAFMKWYKSIFSSSRLFAAIFDKIRPDSILMEDCFPNDIRTLLWAPPGDIGQLIKKSSLSLNDIILEKAVEYIQHNGTFSPDISPFDLIRSIFGYSPNELSMVKRSDMVLHLLTENDFMQDMFWFFLSLPTSLGGKGVNLMINDILSGHSEGLFKQVYYLKTGIDSHMDNKRFFYRWMTTSLGHSLASEESIRITQLCSSTWAGSPDVLPISNYLATQIGRYIANHCVNERIHKLMSLYESRKIMEDGKLVSVDQKTVFLKSLIKLAGKQINPRILQFYAENSIYHIIDLLIKKVETSSGFLNNIQGIDQVRSTIHQLELRSFERSLTSENKTYGEVTMQSDMLEYFTNRRASMFPEVEFIDVDEPLYDHLITPSSGKRVMFSTIVSNRDFTKGGVKVYKKPVFGNEALYKGEYIGEGGLYTCIEELLMSKITSVTMWMTHKFGCASTDHLVEYRNVLFNLADASLSTLSDLTYADIIPYVPLTTGGEIFHRLPNMRYKTDSVIRSMPLSTPMFDVHINQREVTRRNLGDSNINFDYIRHRLIIGQSLKRKYVTSNSPFTHYYLSSNEHIFDVSSFNITELSKERYRFPTPYNSIVDRQPSFERINQLSYNYLTVENPALIDVLIPLQSEEFKMSAIELIIEEAAIKYYNMLQKNHMTISYYYDSIENWRSLISTLQHKYLICVDMSPENLFAKIKVILDKYKKKIIKIDIHKQHSIDNTLIQEYLINEAREEFLSIDIYLDRIAKLAKKINDGKEAEMEENMMNQLINNLNNLNEFQESARISFLFLLIVKYCAQYTIIDGSLRLLRFITDTNLKSLLADARIVLSHDIGELGFLDALCNSGNYIELYRDVEELFDQIDVMLEALDASESFIPGMSLDIQIPKKMDVNIPIPEIAKMCEYRLMPVQHTFFEKAELIKRTLIFIRHVSALYAHPMIYWSSTGSDSFVAQHGLFKTLKSSSMINDDTQVCDLTAGRGDGNIALCDLNIKHKSIARKDIFTVSPLRGSVEFNDNYNVFDWESITFISLYDWIHIDISFTGEVENDITDTIINLMRMRKPFSIRLNSVTWNASILDVAEVMNIYDLQIAYPTSEGLKPYQIYLIGVPKLVKIEEVAESSLQLAPKFKSEMWHKSISENYGILMRPGNIFLQPIDHSVNSSILLFSDAEDIPEFAWSLIKDTKMNSQLYQLEKLSANMHWLNQIIVIKDYLPKKAQKLIAGIPSEETERIGQFYLGVKRTDVGGQRKKRIELYSQHLVELQSGNMISNEIEIKKENVAILDQLRYSHPIKKVRATLGTFLDAVNLKYLDLKDTSIEVDQLISQLKDERSQRFTSSTKSVRIAFLLLVYSALIENYQYGLRILWVRYFTEIYNKQQTTRLMEEYRKISGFYQTIVDNLDFSEKDRALRSAIKTEIIDKIIYNYLKANKEKIIKKKQDESLGYKMEIAHEKTEDLFDWEAVFESFVKGFTDNKDLVLPDPMKAFKDNKEITEAEDILPVDAMAAALESMDLGSMFNDFADKMNSFDAEKAAEYAKEEIEGNYGYSENFGEGYEEEWGCEDY